MADNTADFTKKILVDVEIKSEQVKKDIPILVDTLQQFNDELDNLKKTQKDLEKGNDTSSQKYRDNNKAIVENMQSVRQLKAEIREANKYIDNAAKAINSETGSIQQNRAILSLVTSDYVKLGQVEGQTAESTVKLAVDVNNLTDRLKDQEKQIGQTYRNVGNYTDSINKSSIGTGKAAEAFKQIGGAIGAVRDGIGFMPQKFGNAVTALSTSVQGFGTLMKDYGVSQQLAEKAAYNATLAEEVLAKATEQAAAANIAEAASLITKKEAQAAAAAVTEAATAAEAAQTASAEAAATEAMTAVGVGATVLGGIILALTAGIASYLDQFASYSDSISAGWDKFKANVQSVLNSIANADFGNFAKNWRDAGDNAGYASLRLKDLNRESEASAVLTADEDRQVSLILLKIRDKATTAVEGEKLYQQALSITNEQYKRTSQIAQSSYINTVLAQTAGYNLTKDELKSLTDLSQGYEVVLQNAKQLIELDKLPKDYLKNASPALQAVIQTDTKKDSTDQRLKNRDDSKQAAADAKAKAAEAAAERLAAQQKAAYDDAENMRRQSITKELQDIYESYGDKALAASQAFDNEQTKLKKYLDKKLITQKEYNSVSGQLTKQYNSDIEKITKEFQEQDYQKYLAADNQLRALQIANIQEDTARTIAGLVEKGLEEGQEIDRQNVEIQKTIDSLNTELLNKDKKFSSDELKELQDRLDKQNLLLTINGYKRVEQAKATQEAIDKVNKSSLDSQNKLKDTNDIAEATQKFGGKSKEVQDAKQKQLLDNYNAEVSNEGLTAAAKLEIERKYLLDSQALKDQARNANIDLAAQGEQVVQQGAYDILSQGIQQREQAQIQALENQKANELQNQSLTNTQKKLIEAKYKKEEDKIKLKAFKDNQKLQIANAIISGAVGILKNIAELGFVPSIPINALTLVTTGIEVAKIASQKPPAFAVGGVYESDGKGAALPGYSKHDNMNARLRDGEGIVVSEAMRDPYARNTISAINQAYGGRSFSVPGPFPKNPFTPGFAGGGVFTDGGNANRFYNQPVVATGDLANSLAYQMINNFPNIVVDVKDIISEQSRLITTQNRVVL